MGLVGCINGFGYPHDCWVGDFRPLHDAVYNLSEGRGLFYCLYDVGLWFGFISIKQSYLSAIFESRVGYGNLTSISLCMYFSESELSSLFACFPIDIRVCSKYGSFLSSFLRMTVLFHCNLTAEFIWLTVVACMSYLWRVIDISS